MRPLLALAACALVALPAQAQPRRSAAPQQTVTIADATTPVSVSVRAGGSDRNAVPGSGCSGFINNGQPTATVEVTGGGELSIYAESGTDTTILVSDTESRWHCSDDANGSNPAVTFTDAKPGTYVVWVGTFSPDAVAEARLLVVRRQPVWSN